MVSKNSGFNFFFVQLIAASFLFFPPLHFTLLRSTLFSAQSSPLPPPPTTDVNGQCQAKKRRRLPQWSQASQPPMGDGDDGEAGASSSLRQSSLFQAWGSGNS
mmetsp:Transcript_43650/g.71425  ORF Transcript_43650/g.71425 Transcript_43650/m.71425 type:complete len:103 (-) Transcript_43650:1127-1435(-)